MRLRIQLIKMSDHGQAASNRHDVTVDDRLPEQASTAPVRQRTRTVIVIQANSRAEGMVSM